MKGPAVSKTVRNLLILSPRESRKRNNTVLTGNRHAVNVLTMPRKNGSKQSGQFAAKPIMVYPDSKEQRLACEKAANQTSNGSLTKFMIDCAVEHTDAELAKFDEPRLKMFNAIVDDVLKDKLTVKEIRQKYGLHVNLVMSRDSKKIKNIMVRPNTPRQRAEFVAMGMMEFLPLSNFMAKCVNEKLEALTESVA